MDYLSNISSESGMGLRYANDLATRNNEISSNANLGSMYTEQMSNWETMKKSLKGDNWKDSLSDMGVEIGGEVLAQAYIKSGLQATINGAVRRGIGSIKSSISDAYDSLTSSNNPTSSSSSTAPAEGESIEMTETSPASASTSAPTETSSSETLENNPDSVDVGAAEESTQATADANAATESDYNTAMTEYSEGDYSAAARSEPSEPGDDAEATGADAAEEIGEATGEAVADAVPGLGEILMGYQFFHSIGKDIYDIFHPPPPPPPPPKPVYQSVQQTPSFIQSSAQEGV